MGSVLEWLDSFFVSLENSISSFWNSLVYEEQSHPIILALALFIVLSVFLTLLCNCCCWCCGLCRPRTQHAGLVYVPAYYNYGTMMPPPVPGQSAPMEGQPTTSKQETTALVHV